MSATPDATVFEAVIVPHRSLSPRALGRLLLAVVLMCGSSAAMFVWLGAWPVGGFTGLELLLAAALFRLNAQGARASEVVVLTQRHLRILRTDRSGGRTQVTLPPSWLRVRLEERPGRVPGLVLACPTAQEEIARSLGEADKRDLAQALAEALDQWRNPRFDNPQLR